MDTITNAGGGATNLSTPQKIIATLLSVILVVGLSPFGQVPMQAYASNAPSIETNYRSSDIEITVKPVNLKYTNQVWASSDSTDAGAMIESVVFKKNGTATELDSSDYSLTYLNTSMTTKYNKIRDAGTYVVMVTLKNTGTHGTTISSKAEYWNTKEFTIDPVDISGIRFNANTLQFTGSPQVISLSGTLTNTNPVPNYDLVAGTDYVADVDTVTEVGTTSVNITGKGNFTGTTKASVTVSKVPFLAAKPDGNTDKNLKIKDSEGEKEVSDTTNGTTVTGTVTDGLKAAYGNTSSPFELKFGETTLTEGRDYSVAYYSTTGSKLNSAPSAKGSYRVEFTPLYNSGRFNTSDYTCKVSCDYAITAGSIADVANKATFDAGAYLGGAAVTVDSKTAKFFDEDGNDVTATIGSDFSVESASYAVADSNTAKTAEVSSNKPVGAGVYTVSGITGGGTNYGTTNSISGTFTVEPAAAVEGDAKGNLVITLADAAYNPYSSSTPLAPSIYMYTDANKTKSPSIPDKVVDSTNDKTLYTNWTVTYYKDGEKVAEPTEVGTYSAVFEFDGNLKGTAPITKEVQIKPQDVSNLIDSVEFTNLVYTGSAIDAEPIFKKGSSVVTDEDIEDAGCTYEISYTQSGTGVLDPTTGKPFTVGSYTATVTFSGSYAGTKTATVRVVALALSGDSKNGSIQFLQDDGETYETYYSTTLPASGGAEVKGYRVVVDSAYGNGGDIVADAATQGTCSNNTATTTAAVLSVKAASGYTAYVTGTGTANFTIADFSFSSVNAAVTLGATESDYSGSAKSVTVSVVSPTAGNLEYGTHYQLQVLDEDGEVVNGAITGTPGATSATLSLTDAGVYTIVAYAGTTGKYAGRITATYTIKALDISNANVFTVKFKPASDVAVAIDDDWAIDYDPAATDGIELGMAGNATSAGVSVYKTTGTSGYLTPTTDFKVAYENNTVAGTATATITGEGNYAGTVTKAFTINRVALGYVAAAGSVSGTPGFVATFVEDDELKLDGNGNAHMSFSGSALTPTFKFEYKDASGESKPTIELGSEQYDVKWFDNTNVAYTSEAKPVVAAGAVLAIEAKDTGNYKGTIYASFTIDPIDLSDENVVIEDIADQPYTGEPIVPAVGISFGDYELVQGTDFTVTADNTGAVGEATVNIDVPLKGNFTAANGTITKSFNIVKGESTITLAAKSATYTGQDIDAPVAVVTGSKGAVTYKYYSDAACTTEVSAHKDAGTYYVKATVAADDNYNEATSGAAKLTIAKAKNSAFKVTAKTVKAKAKKVTKVNAKKAFTVKGKAGKVTYKKVKGAKKIAVAKNGKVTVKKGLKAGKTYKVKVKVTSAANTNYEAASKTVVLKVKVAK